MVLAYESSRFDYSPVESKLILSLRFFAHLNVTIRLDLIVRFSPVAGFLPLRGAFSWTTYFPNPEISTFSPEDMVFFSRSIRVSTTSVALCLVNPVCTITAWIISVLVSLGILLLEVSEIVRNQGEAVCKWQIQSDLSTNLVVCILY